MSLGQFNRFVRKTATQKKMRVLICCVAALSTLSFMYYSSPSSSQESDKILHRHTRSMKSMIDMRGFPDTEGLCPHAGFFRNKTDCTQFYRCVDFYRNGKHTVFRFMCGPMTVFDPSRSLCTGPRMAVPPCTLTPPTPTPPTPTPPTPTPPEWEPPPPTPPTLPNPPENECRGILVAKDEDLRQTQDIERILIPSYSVSGIISCGDRNEIVYIQDAKAKTITLPSGIVSIIISNKGDGQITNISNGFFTTNSTIVSLPNDTTYEIIQFVEGRAVNRTTLPIPKEETQIVVPEKSIYGKLTFTNNQVDTIGGWRFTTEYLSTEQTKAAIFGIISNVKTLQTSVSTNYKVFNSGSQFISGIITVQGSSADGQSDSSLLYTISVTSKDKLAIIPEKGTGNIALNKETLGNLTIPITPGTILAIQPPVDSSGMVTDLLQSKYTSETTKIIFPAGSNVIVYKIRINGQLEKISEMQVSSTFTVSSVTKSFVGIIQTSTDGTVRQIATGYFDVKLVNESPDQAYVGVLNLNSAEKEYQSVAGIIKIGDPSFLDYQQSISVQTIQILPNATSAVLVSGEINITEENGISIKQTAVSIPSGGIFGIVTLTNGGEITGISNSYFTTNSTQLVFPFGVRYGIFFTNTDGTTQLQNPIDTTVKTVVTVPVGSVFGKMDFSSRDTVTGIGNAYFATQKLITGYSNLPAPSTLLDIFGVIYFSEEFNLSRSVATSSTTFNSGLRTISAIVHITAPNRLDSIDSLSVAQGSSLAIIPNTGQGVVSVDERGSYPLTNFTLLPGQMFSFFNVRDAKVTNINNGFFTTNTTSISFGPGTNYGIIEIDFNGSIKVLDDNFSRNDLYITVAKGSTVGSLNLIKNDDGESVVSIGGAPFVIRNLTFQSTQTSANSAIGILEIDRFLQTTTSTTTTSTTTTSTTTPSTTTSTSTPSTTTTPRTTTPETTPKPPFSIDCTSDKPLQFPLDCSRFYQCVSDGDQRNIFVLPCAPGLYFDDVSSQCRTPAEAVCKDKSAINDTTNSLDGPGGIIRLVCNENLYRYPLNCNNFYTCFKDDEGHEIINVFACAAGLAFDDSSLRCLLPNETLSCDDSNNFFKSPSFVFQLQEEIDTVSILSKSRDIFKKQ